MVELSDTLHCLFHASVEEQSDSFVIEIPDAELADGAVQAETVYRVAILPPVTPDDDDPTPDPPEEHSQGTDADDDPVPPVTEGEQRTVEIEDIGEQGDGIARVDRGYVVIVPNTEQGERVTVEITNVNTTVSFGEVVSREENGE